MKSPTQKRHTHRMLVGAMAILLAGFFADRAHADAPAELVQQANEAITKGDIDAALAQYEEASQLAPDRFELAYNQAVAHYRKGDYEAARALFTRSVGDRELEAKARFNLANCDYAEAVGLAEQDRAAAIAKLQSAISHYRGALDANPQDGDSRANAELARMLIEQLNKEEEKEQEQEKEQEKEQNQEQEQNQEEEQDQEQEQEQDGQKKQDGEQEQEQEQQQNQEQDGQQEQEQEQEQDGQQEQDQEQGKGQEQDGEQEQDGQEEGDSQEDSEQEKESRDEPKNSDEDHPSEDQENKQDGESPHENQQADQPGKESESDEPEQEEADPVAGDEPEKQDMQEQHGTGGGTSHEEPAQGVPGSAGSEPREVEAQPMTKEEAEKMLQAVRDRDLKRRYEKLQQQRRHYQPVERDW